MEHYNGYDIWPQPGLIFNDNIYWNKEIQVLFQRNPCEILMHDGGSYIKPSLDFTQIPYSRQEARIEFRDFCFYKYSVYSEEEEDFNNQLEYQAKLRESVAYEFSINEMIHIISDSNNHSQVIELLNRNLFNQFLDVLNKNIVDFEIDKFFEIIKKIHLTMSINRQNISKISVFFDLYQTLCVTENLSHRNRLVLILTDTCKHKER